MGINIRQQRENWFIKINEEEWEVNSFEEMKKLLDELLELKKKYGQLKYKK